MNSSNQSSSPIPSADQLAASRLKQWHQNGEALLTFENLRSWINAAGLALYSPRATQLPAPAPSMVEAVLGATNTAPTLSDTEQARTLLSRLVAEGAVVPLNLLGNPTGVGTDVPDFIAATAVLPYIFTLRGDKSWKLPPETSGASKVSPLALAAYTHLSERAKDSVPGLAAYDLATQLGKEVTENAVLRALTELWQHLRVLPIPQEGAATLWELTSTRFTKQIKAGSNAGQPTALSALISLYLGQAVVATEEEIEVFLSPLAARSRIRDVIHALLGARQLETIAIEGRTMLHVAGDLPTFLATPAAESELAVPVDDIGILVVTTEGPTPTAHTGADGDASRIKKFVPAPRKIGTGFVTKPGFSKPARKPFGEKAVERVRRPFLRESNRPDRPSFTKPWAEEKADRLAAASAASTVPDNAEAATYTPSSEAGEATFQKPAYTAKPAYDRKPGFGSKPSFGRKPSFGDKPRYGDKPSYGERSSSGDRPSYGAKRSFGTGGDSRPPRREYTRPASDQASGPGDFAPRKSFSHTGSKPGSFDRKREGGFTARPSYSRDNDSRPPRREFTPRPGGDSRPPRRDFGSRPTSSARPPREGGFSARPNYPPRDSAGTESTGPRFRKFDAPRGDRPARPFNADRPSRPYNAERSSRPYNPERSSRPYSPERSSRPYSQDRSQDRPARPFNSDRGSRPESSSYAGKSGSYEGKSSGFAAKKPYSKPGSGGYSNRSSGAGYEGKSSSYGDKKPYGKSSGGYAGKSSGSAGKKPFGKSGGFSAKPGKPAGTFDKFKGNKKPFGNRPPARKWKPEASKSAE